MGMNGGAQISQTSLILQVALSQTFPGARQWDHLHFSWCPGAPGNRGALASSPGILALSLVSWRLVVWICRSSVFSSEKRSSNWIYLVGLFSGINELKHGNFLQASKTLSKW